MTVKPYTVEKVKDIRGRKITGYRVRQRDREWSGKTAQAALAAREVDIAAACVGRHNPIVLSNNFDTWIGYYSFPDGWRYDRVRERRTDGCHEVYGSGGYQTREECERYLRCLVAGDSYRIGSDDERTILYDACDYLASSVIEPEDIAEHLVKIAWQRGAKLAADKGFAVCISPDSPGDKIADACKSAESSRVYGLIRAHRERGVWSAGFSWIEYLRGKN